MQYLYTPFSCAFSLLTWPGRESDQKGTAPSVEQDHCTLIAVKRYRDPPRIGGRHNFLLSTKPVNKKRNKSMAAICVPRTNPQTIFFFFFLQIYNFVFFSCVCASAATMGYWRNRKRASFARTRYWDRNPDDPFFYFCWVFIFFFFGTSQYIRKF